MPHQQKTILLGRFLNCFHARLKEYEIAVVHKIKMHLQYLIYCFSLTYEILKNQTLLERRMEGGGGDREVERFYVHRNVS